MKIGYKGTDKNLKCRNVQFELGKTYFINDKEEVEELPEGFTVIKSKVKLCSKEALHYCDNLENVFIHYPDNKSNRFFKVEILGDFEDGDKKSGARCIKFLEEVSKEDLKNLKRLKEEEKLDKYMKIETVKSLQQLNPNLIIGGSISLYLQGIKLTRFHSNNSDYDLIFPYYQQIQHPKDMQITEGEDMPSGCDYQFSVNINGVKADIRVDPTERYELIEYKGFNYKCTPILKIIEAKVKYFSGKNGKKHKEDILEMTK